MVFLLKLLNIWHWENYSYYCVLSLLFVVRLNPKSQLQTLRENFCFCQKMQIDEVSNNQREKKKCKWGEMYYERNLYYYSVQMIVKFYFGHFKKYGRIKFSPQIFLSRKKKNECEVKICRKSAVLLRFCAVICFTYNNLSITIGFWRSYLLSHQIDWFVFSFFVFFC